MVSITNRCISRNKLQVTRPAFFDGRISNFTMLKDNQVYKEFEKEALFLDNASITTKYETLLNVIGVEDILKKYNVKCPNLLVFKNEDYSPSNFLGYTMDAIDGYKGSEILKINSSDFEKKKNSFNEIRNRVLSLADEGIYLNDFHADNFVFEEETDKMYSIDGDGIVFSHTQPYIDRYLTHAKGIEKIKGKNGKYIYPISEKKKLSDEYNFYKPSIKTTNTKLKLMLLELFFDFEVQKCRKIIISLTHLEDYIDFLYDSGINKKFVESIADIFRTGEKRITSDMIESLTRSKCSRAGYKKFKKCRRF